MESLLKTMRKINEPVSEAGSGENSVECINSVSTDESAAANRAKYDEAAVRDGYRKLTRLLIEKR